MNNDELRHRYTFQVDISIMVSFLCNQYCCIHYSFLLQSFTHMEYQQTSKHLYFINTNFY